MRQRILILDDRNETGELAVSLKALGYEVDRLRLASGINRSAIERADLIVLEILESSARFLPVLSELRSFPYYPPLLAILHGENASRLALLLECGCDCVVRHDEDVLLVKAWIESLLRRREMYRIGLEKSEPTIRVGDIEIDVPARMVRTKTKRSELTEREMKLLLELAQTPGAVCKRSDLLLSVWGSATESLTGTLNTHVNRLRIKIEEDFRNPKYLLGVYGVGYRLVPDVREQPAEKSDLQNEPACELARAPTPVETAVTGGSRPAPSAAEPKL